MKKLNMLTLIALSAIVLFTGCGDKKATPKLATPAVFNEITKSICKEDTTQSYALYIPKSKPKDVKLPVIYAFDPHGDGQFAVEHLKEAAEILGFIIAGSNNSKNGLQTIDHTINILVTDVLQNQPVDPERQYAAGFSGGGRVASYLALQNEKIRGIITCGAGLSGFNPQSVANKFEIFAIVGLGDFNFDETMSINDQLKGTDWKHICSFFEGSHEWPPSKELTKAVLWFQFNAMASGKISKDKQLIGEFADTVVSRVEKLKQQNQYVLADNECQIGVSILEGLAKPENLLKQLDEFKASDPLKIEKLKIESLGYLEQQLRNGYLQSLKKQELNWWTTEIKSLNGKINNAPTVFEKQMYSRVKGFLGIICYSYTAQAVAENNQPLAAKIIGIYEAV